MGSLLSAPLCVLATGLWDYVDPQVQIARKINENWQLYLIMQPSAMCLQQTFFLRRVIILTVPIWVRLYFGNWFWILDPFLFEPSCWNPFYQCLWAEAQMRLASRHQTESCFCSSWKPRGGECRECPGCTYLPGLWDMLAWHSPPCWEVFIYSFASYFWLES